MAFSSATPFDAAMLCLSSNLSFDDWDSASTSGFLNPFQSWDEDANFQPTSDSRLDFDLSSPAPFFSSTGILPATPTRYTSPTCPRPPTKSSTYSRQFSPVSPSLRLPSNGKPRSHLAETYSGRGHPYPYPSPLSTPLKPKSRPTEQDFGGQYIATSMSNKGQALRRSKAQTGARPTSTPTHRFINCTQAGYFATRDHRPHDTSPATTPVVIDEDSWRNLSQAQMTRVDRARRKLKWRNWTRLATELAKGEDEGEEEEESTD